ncbi:MAG: cupin [Sphingobacteriaceae bacterium]|nr:cupin [Sphingobacteriaceae bacterium]
MPYIKNPQPFVVPTTDGKMIEEHHGRASTGTTDYSLAHMVAPPGWSEPFQSPLFDEITIVIHGKKQFELDGETLVLGAGEAILVKAGSRVRYSNPHSEPTEYWSICMPAFSLETVNREG